jgi:hypothetical protein
MRVLVVPVLKEMKECEVVSSKKQGDVSIDMLIVKVEESVKNESASSASAVEMKDGEVVSSKEQGDVSIDMLNVKVEESVKNESASSASAVEMKDGEVVSSKEQGDVSKEEKAIVKTSDGVKVHNIFNSMWYSSFLSI